EVCAYFSRTYNLPTIALRLFHPVSDQEATRRRQEPDDPTLAPRASHLAPECSTAATDLARALTAALLLEHEGFEAIHLTGDTTGRAYHHEKAKRLLDWLPANP